MSREVAIESVDPVAAEEWDEVWRSCDYATFFHSRGWHELWSRYTAGKLTPASLRVTFSDGKTAVLPMTRRLVLRGLLETYESSPVGTFGGWISTDGLDANHSRLLTGFLIRSVRNLTWRVNPYDPFSATITAAGMIVDETHVLDLAPGFDGVFKGWSKGHRAAVRQAEKYGVAVRVAEDERMWREYYRAYEDSLRRWGERATTTYRWELMEALSKRPAEEVRLWVATHADEVVAGALCLYAKNHVVYWHGAALESHFHMRPVNLVVCRAIEHACRTGLRWFDFNPSGGQEGVAAFKKSFGAEAHACPVVKTRSLGMRVMGAVARFMRPSR